MFRRQVTMAAVLAIGGVFSWLATSDRMGELFAQQTKTDSQSEGTPKVLPRPDFEYKGQVGKTYKDSDPRVPSPTMDKLATVGQRYTRFHTTALCSPTRAALLTGRNHTFHRTASSPMRQLGTKGIRGLFPEAVGQSARYSVKTGI